MKDEPAFPGMEYDNTAGQRYHYGMTLREYYAGCALQGVLSNKSRMGELSARNGPIKEFYADLAFEAFGIADAMIANDSV